MWNRFTEASRGVLKHAEMDVRDFGHVFVEPDHLVLGGALGARSRGVGCSAGPWNGLRPRSPDSQRSTSVPCRTTRSVPCPKTQFASSYHSQFTSSLHYTR